MNIRTLLFASLIIAVAASCGRPTEDGSRGPLGSGAPIDVPEAGEEGTVLTAPEVTIENNVTIYNYTVQLKSGRVIKIKHRCQSEDSGSDDHGS
jgi:hypothetical protein